MPETHGLSPERQDMVDLERARGVIQRRWLQSPSAVIRFQTMCGQSTAERTILDDDATIRIHLNPLRAWCRLRTSKFLVDDVPRPATVLLFAVGHEFATRVFQLEEQTLINELVDYQPCTLDQWSTHSALATRDQLVSFCEELSDSGLVCFSSTSHPCT